jgi:predicted kinase
MEKIMTTMYLIIGVPGSGKSTKAKELVSQNNNICHYEADMFFEQEGNYVFDFTKLCDAHKWCQKKCIEAMKESKDVIVSNTSLSKKERSVYFEMAKRFNYEIVVMTMTGNYQNIHNVSKEKIEKMKQRYEPFTEEELK